MLKFFVWSFIIFVWSYNAYGQDYMTRRFKFKNPVNKILLSNATLRYAPATGGTDILTIPKGKTVRLLGLFDGYYRAIYEGDIGFIHFLYIDGDEKTFSEINYPPDGRIGYYDYESESNNIVHFGKAALTISLRTEPTMASEKVCTVPKGTVLKLTHHNAGYWLTEYEGYVGYMGKEFVNDVAKGYSDAKAYESGLFRKAEIEKREDAKAEAEVQKMIREAVNTSSHPYIRGPRGGCYYINSHGNKTYVDRSLCN